MNMLRLKQARLDRGISQKEAALFFGVSQQAYSNYESGLRQPTYETLAMMCDYFSVSADYLLGRTDAPQPYLPLQPVALPAAPALTEPETDLLGSFRKLNAEGQTAALGALRLFTAMPEYKKHPVSGAIQEIG